MTTTAPQGNDYLNYYVEQQTALVAELTAVTTQLAIDYATLKATHAALVADYECFVELTLGLAATEGE